MVTVPGYNPNDPAHLEALYGNFGLFEHWRKVVLSDCKEMIRAQMLEEEVKPTDKRLDDLGHIHPIYVEFLTQGLQGRIKREQNVRETMGGMR